MKVDRCKKSYLSCDDELVNGSWIKTRSGDWHQVLKVEGKGYVQSTTGSFSIQSRNDLMAKQIIYIFDGRFMQKKDISEVYKMYDEVYEPNHTHVVLELLEYKNC